MLGKRFGIRRVLRSEDEPYVRQERVPEKQAPREISNVRTSRGRRVAILGKIRQEQRDVENFRPKSAGLCGATARNRKLVGLPFLPFSARALGGTTSLAPRSHRANISVCSTILRSRR